MKGKPVVVLSLVLGLLAVRPAAADGLRVLIFSGQNNHNWRETTPKLKAILEADGRFAVDVTEHPEQCDAATLARYDAVVSNWNTFGKAAVTNWPDATRAAVIDFVRKGKGFVSIHAGSSSFADWAEYQQITGAWWQLGETNHGAPHPFTVQATADHPITHGVQPFGTTDELWKKPGLHPAATVLAMGDDQPVALVTQFGKGRGFTLLLGHSAAFMDNLGFQTLFTRGVQWAATGQVTPHDVYQPLARYQYGQDRAILLEVASLVQIAPRETAPKLAILLDSDATLDCKKFVCEQLGLIGTAAEVPLLARQLANPDLALAARAALERIPAEESLSALRAALPGASGALRQGLINSLGARGDTKAVSLLAGLLPDSADALAAIGTPQALEALQAARPPVPEALLRCALKLRAVTVLEKLSAAEQPKGIRVAAFMGRVNALGEQGGAAILAALSSGDSALEIAAIGMVRTSGVAKAAAEQWTKLPAELQVPLLAALGDSGQAAVLPTVTRAAASPQPAVRRAAIVAIGQLGDASSVPVLFGLLEAAEKDEQQAIVDALTRLRGPGVDTALVQNLRPETIRALVARGAKPAVPALLTLADTGSAEAISALGKLAEAADGPSLMALLDKAADRYPVEAALTALYRRTGDVQPVVDAAARASGPRKASLLTVLGSLGGDQALAVLREVLQGADAEAKLAAVRALSNWQTGAPLADLQAVATTSTDAKLKAIAARGAAQLEALGFDVTGMPNLALGGTATNPDGLKPDGQAGPPAAAIDGNRNTYWDEVDNQKLYQLRVQMKRPALVRAIRITGFQQQHFAPKDFQIVCDEKVVKTVKDAPYRDNVLMVVVPPTHCTTVQLNITGYYGGSPAIRELEIYGKAD
jgi:type 1 glutamine amidotransferase/HEAT repeat protein